MHDGTIVNRRPTYHVVPYTQPKPERVKLIDRFGSHKYLIVNFTSLVFPISKMTRSLGWRMAMGHGHVMEAMGHVMKAMGHRHV